MKHHREIDKAIKALRQQVKLAVDDVNRQAARLVEKGAYDASQQLIDSAKRITAFADQVEALASTWQACREMPNSEHQNEQTPLWEYYRLIAKSLIDLGGEAAPSEVIAKIASLGADQFRSGDLAVTRTGRPRWERAVRRARRPMIDEGFIEAVRGGRWRVTKLGRNLPKRGNE